MCRDVTCNVSTGFGGQTDKYFGDEIAFQNKAIEVENKHR